MARPEVKAKMSAGLKGNQNAKGNKSSTGKHTYNNGIKNVWAFECPEGFTKG